MKKLALLLAIVMTFSPLTFAITPVNVESVSENDVAQKKEETATLSASTVPGLYYYQDFDDIPDGVYTLDALQALTGSLVASPDENVTMNIGKFNNLNDFAKYEIKHDESGNGYLELTTKDYASFAVKASNTDTRYMMMMSFNYYYPTAPATDPFSKGIDNSSVGTSDYYTDWSTKVTSNTATSWTYTEFISGKFGSTYPYGSSIGFLCGQPRPQTVICIDDIRVWMDDDATTAYPSMPNTWTPSDYTNVIVSFDPGTQFSDVEMPETTGPEPGAAAYTFLNVPGATSVMHSYSLLYLNKYKPKGSAPYGYTFGGWSLTDGGRAIKSHEASSFKIVGDMTLYPVWNEREKVTITFANSTTNAPQSATLPNAVTPYKWASTEDNVDLSTFAASTTEKYQFLGWSASDNGEIITDLTAYQPTSSTTFYAVWKSDSTATGLYFYQDFESLPASTSNYYGPDKVAEWLSVVDSPMSDVSVSLNSISGMNGFAARVMQDEETGNKFLRIQTNSGNYLSFGAHFSDDKLRGFNMAFNYRYTGSHQADFVKTHDTGDSYYSEWKVENDGTPSTWTYKAWKTDTLSNGLGLAVNNKTIYLDIDDIRVWCVKSADEYIPASNYVNMDLTAKITFDPGSIAEGADVTMPTFKHSWDNNVAIVNIPGRTDVATNYHRHDYVNLEACIPTGAPIGYEFAGWSVTDGGSKIKDSEYSNYKITGNQTLYALWSEIVLPEEIITYTLNENNPKGVADGTFTVAAVNEVQGYTNAQLVYANDEGYLPGYTQIADLDLSNYVATYTFEGGKSYPKGATRIAVRFYAEDKEDYTIYYNIPEENRFDADQTPLFTFYAVSDLHYGEDYWATSTANRNAMVADIQNSNVDFVVINGDLVNHGVEGQYTAFDTFIGAQFNAKGIPAFITNGNHEFFINNTNSTAYNRTALLNTFSTQLSALCEMGYAINRTGDNLWYSTVIDGAKFIFMSTPDAPNAENLASMTVTQEQLDFLDAELLDGQKAGLPVFVFTHVQLEGYVPNATGGITNTADVAEILNKYDGVTVISGHTHSNLSYDLPFVKLPANSDTFTHVNDGCGIWLKAYNNEGTGNGGTIYQQNFSAGYVVEVYGDKVIFKARRFAPDANGGNAYFGHGQYVWYFGELTKSANITRFANSTTNAPAETVVPQAVVTDTDVAVDLSVFATTKENYVFKGWSLTDNGEILTEYVPTGDGILYAVWQGVDDYFKPQNVEKGVRTIKPVGIRAVAQYSDLTRLLATDTEVGFIVTRAVLLGDTLPEDFTFEFTGAFVHGECYDQDTDNLWYNYLGDDITAFSAAFVGIPAKNYNDVLVFRAYRTFVYNGVSHTTYGDPVSTTVLDIADAILASESSTQEDKDYAQKLKDDFTYANY